MSQSLVTLYKEDILAQYRAQKQMADAALARVGDDAFFKRLSNSGDEHTNSVAILVKHLGGNLHSRWSDFLTTDGEKPDRRREQEFMQEEAENRATIMQKWELGWKTAFDTLDALREEDFTRTVTIRGEPHTVVQAIDRNLTHAAHHIGQVDLLATLLQRT
ncbi:MAG: DUF1572 family protein [Anaerolineae bacterium]